MVVLLMLFGLLWMRWQENEMAAPSPIPEKGKRMIITHPRRDSLTSYSCIWSVEQTG